MGCSLRPRAQAQALKQLEGIPSAQSEYRGQRLLPRRFRWNDHACGDNATQIVRWHLQEAHRLLGDLDALPAMAAAIRFDAWLRDEAKRTGDGQIPTTRVYRYGPGCVRDNKDLKDAVALLAEHGRAWLEEEGRRRFVVVNPALYAG